MTAAIVVCTETTSQDRRSQDLPRPARLAFGFAAQLRRGTLDVTLPDGRRLRFGGARARPGRAP